MAIKYLKLKVHRSEMHTVIRDFPEWEMPILEAMHGTVEVEGKPLIVNRAPPDAQDEYARLERRYGRQENEDGSKGIPYVAAVYGQHGVGVARLKQAIEAGTVEDAPETAEDLIGSVG